jgi:hypothetical protein
MERRFNSAFSVFGDYAPLSLLMSWLVTLQGQFRVLIIYKAIF